MAARVLFALPIPLLKGEVADWRRRAERTCSVRAIMKAEPSVIGRYQIRARLGEGGMGAVYLARDPSIGRLVAVKVLRVNSAETRARFLREAQTGGRLHHPNIVTIYDCGEDAGRLFIAMEFVIGETLSTLLARRAPLSLHRTLTLANELCDGLAYAHSQGFVHRDVKPDNLMVTTQGRLKILDFGIARLADSSMTAVGALLGTPNYMSPEQVEGGDIDHRSDVFAVGLVLYELLALRPAFSGKTAHDVLYRIVHSQPAALDDLAPGLDPELARAVDRAIEKRPERRYQTLTDLRADLKRVGRRLAARTSVAETIASHHSGALRRQSAGVQADTDVLPFSTDRAAPGGTAPDEDHGDGLVDPAEKVPAADSTMGARPPAGVVRQRIGPRSREALSPVLRWMVGPRQRAIAAIASLAVSVLVSRPADLDDSTSSNVRNPVESVVRTPEPPPPAPPKASAPGAATRESRPTSIAQPISERVGQERASSGQPHERRSIDRQIGRPEETVESTARDDGDPGCCVTRPPSIEPLAPSPPDGLFNQALRLPTAPPASNVSCRPVVPSADTSTRIRVYVSVAPSRSGLVDIGVREREDAAQDLREHIVKWKKDRLELAASRNRADLCVEIVDRLGATTRPQESPHIPEASTNQNGDDRLPRPTTTRSREVRGYTVKAVLTAGDHGQELTGMVSDTHRFLGPWRAAAAELAEAIAQFARKNQATLIASRVKS